MEATSALDALSELPAGIAAQALAAACDIALVIDSHGIIRDIRTGNDDFAGAGLETWLNRPWADTVSDENQVKIAELIAGNGEPGRWRQVNHTTPTGDLPVRYLAIPAGDDGRIVAIGRDMRAAAAMQQRLLRAQQAMERDSLQLRQLEARYRLLFDSALEAIVIVDATTRRIIEANPAAARLADGVELAGQSFATLVHPDDRETAAALLGAIAATEQRHPGRLRLTDGTICLLVATLFRQDRGNFLLVRLRSVVTDGETARERPLAEVLERMPDAFVLTDAELGILAANGAFLDLVDVTRTADIRGVPLWRFVGRPGIDLGLLQTQLREHGIVTNFNTVIRPRSGRETEVELSGVSSEEQGELRHGFTMRTVTRAPRGLEAHGGRSVEQLTELVGRVSLKEIVRESTDLIERLCIEAALAYTSDNRASAAEILGLSRQSLYSKLHRHGLGNLSDD